jgi:hypothetical protein
MRVLVVDGRDTERLERILLLPLELWQWRPAHPGLLGHQLSVLNLDVESVGYDGFRPESVNYPTPGSL